MVLWCGHAVLPFPSFGLVFLFHLVCSLAALALAGAILFGFLFLSPLFLSLAPVLDPLAASMVAMLWSWDSLQAYSFLPFRLDLSGLGVGVSSQSFDFHFGCFWTPSFFVPRLLWLLVRPPLPIFLGVSCIRLLSGVLRRTYPSFVFMCEDILSAFEILSLVSPFLSLSGVEVCLVLFPFFVGAGSRTFCLRSFVLKAVDSSLGSGKFRSPFFVCGRSLLRFFSFVFYPVCVVRTELWSFFFSNKNSGGPQVIFFLGLGSGAAAPCVSLWYLSLCGLLGDDFVLSFSPPLAVYCFSGLLEDSGCVWRLFGSVFCRFVA